MWAEQVAARVAPATQMSSAEYPFEEMQCPLCGYVLHEAEYPQIAIDPACPRCGAYRVSEFIPCHIEMGDNSEGQ